MKKNIRTLIAVAMISAAANAQTLNVETGSVTYAIPAAQAGEMVCTDGETLTIMGRAFATDGISRMYVNADEVSDNTVNVCYDGSTAGVTVAGNIARYVTADVSGAHVTIVQSAEVGEDTCGEITYVLEGSSDDGAFTLEGTYKATIELNGLALTNPSGAPLDIQNGKRIALSVQKGTANTLTDGASGS